MRRDWQPFDDRVDAGRELGRLLADYAGQDAVVLGLPRGGVPVAAEVAEALGAPLDVLLVRKLGVPTHPELAMGAIADVGDGIEVITNQPVVDHLRIPATDFAAVFEREKVELRRRADRYRGARPPLDLAGKVVVLVDDGLATGSTMRAAVAAVRSQQPRRVVVAVPVGAPDTVNALGQIADAVVCARMPVPFSAVRQGYRDFDQTPDAEVLRALGRDPDTSRPTE